MPFEGINNSNEIKKQHICTSFIEGGYIYFICPNCSFKQKVRLETGGYETLDEGDTEATHEGGYQNVSSKDFNVSEN